MKIDVDYKLGQKVYLKNDPEQSPQLVSRIILEAKGAVTLELFTHLAEYIEVPEFLVTKERNELKAAGVDKDED